MITVSLDAGQLGARLGYFFQALERDVGATLKSAAGEALGRIKAGAYWRPGPKNSTAKSFRVRPAGSLHYELSSDDPNAARLDQGTKAHVIEARGRALRIHLSGGAIFRKRVRHPGTKAIHFEAQEAQIAEGELPERIEIVTQRAASEAGLG